MKIIMLGHTNVGKTTYMASMYGKLQDPVKGFGLRTTNMNHHQELNMMYQDIRAGIYPVPSLQRQRYDFSLLYKREVFFPFIWMDYRGGALLEHSSSAEAAQLVKDLRDADGIVIFCDSDPKEGQKVIRQVNRMMQFVGQSLQDRVNPATITIVFTKCDLTNRPDDELFAPTLNLVETISRSESVVGTIIPVACGRKAVNVDLPVLFTLCLGVLLERRLLAKRVEYYQDREKRYDQEGSTLDGFFGNFGRMWRGEETTWKQATDARKSAQENLNKIQALVKPSEQLAKYIGRAHKSNAKNTSNESYSPSE
jgi:GTPase SAR1 family protein